MRVCLYFPREDRAPGCNGIKPGALVVTGNFVKGDRQEAAHAFLKIFLDLIGVRLNLGKSKTGKDCQALSAGTFMVAELQINNKQQICV